MTEVPFQLLIKRCDPKKQTERLLCTELLRCVPGRRQVYEASWNEKSVIVKVFSDKISAKRHTTREWRGLEELSKRQLTVPQSLFYGQTENGGWSVVSEKIVDSSTALDIYQNLQTSAERLDLLILVGRELAKQHIKGVLQKDLHLGNFLLKNDKVFLLDAGQMCFLDGEIGKKDSLYQLATLAAWLDENEKESINRLCSEYFDVRGWNFEEADKAAVWKYLASGRKKAIKRGLKKFLRTNKRHIKINNEKYTAVFDREFCLGAEPLEFIEKIDALMDDGKILKDGNTCYVSRLTWNGRDVVVKRYNHKGLIHSIRHTIKGSRARRCWICGHRLGMLKLATPKPLVYLEHRKGLLIWKSYI
ncbi:MAG: hypothetical protein JW715_15030, partial [Sedimentisphaerales bacterium]|nr:hypothetical protein [Sedimentisphaerales bacterium]